MWHFESRENSRDSDGPRAHLNSFAMALFAVSFSLSALLHPMVRQYFVLLFPIGEPMVMLQVIISS